MSFIQTMRYQTTRPAEIDDVIDEWIATTDGRRTPTRSLTARDRSADDTYVLIVEFPSPEAAAANNELPETGEFARRFGALCTSPIEFQDLDVTRDLAL